MRGSSRPRRLFAGRHYKGREGIPGRRSRERFGSGIRPRIARWIAEREGKTLAEDGSLTMEHPLADTDWAVRHVLQYGPEVTVLEPAEVREAVVQRLQGMANA